MVRPGNRIMDITEPIIGFTELRPDLSEFEAPLVISNGGYDNSHNALLAGGLAWLALGMDKYEITQNAQFRGGEKLTGFKLQRLAGLAEEIQRQHLMRPPEVEISKPVNEEPSEQASITGGWLAEQPEIPKNRRPEIVDFFDSTFLEPDIRDFRRAHYQKLSDNPAQSDNVNRNDSIHKEET